MRQLFVSLFLCLCFALTIAASDSTGKGKTESAGADTALAPPGYASRVGALLDTYRPLRSDHSPAHRVRAANRFLRSLNDGQRRSAHYSLTSVERTEWTNAPARGEVGGLALGDLNEAQLRAFSDLLAAVLSETGYHKIRDMMLGDDLRAYIDGKINAGVGIEACRVSVFGEPSVTSRWAVQLDGHHIALNLTLEGTAYSMSPSFIGTFPQAFSVAGVERRPLAGATDLAHELVHSLTPAQRTLAVISEQRGALRVGAGQDGVVPEPVGIRGKSLNEVQKDKLLALASQWFELMPRSHARAQRERFFAALDETWFAWSGPLVAGSDMSYAIQGPSIIIEYANDARGGSRGGNPVDHVHTIYRDLDREYGGGYHLSPPSQR